MEIMISENNLVSVDVIDEVVEICMMDKLAGHTLLKINMADWEEICVKVIEDMEKGASPGEDVE
ncbi:hypothetical protein ES703_124892 [subsurface metagenome]